jgi:hypothetical protein
MERHALRDDQFARIEHLLTGRPGTVGRSDLGNRLFVDAVIWKFRVGMTVTRFAGTFWRLEQYAQALLPLGGERCYPAWGPDADRRPKRLIELASVGSWAPIHSSSLSRPAGILLQTWSRAAVLLAIVFWSNSFSMWRCPYFPLASAGFRRGAGWPRSGRTCDRLEPVAYRFGSSGTKGQTIGVWLSRRLVNSPRSCSAY